MENQKDDDDDDDDDRGKDALDQTRQNASTVKYAPKSVYVSVSTLRPNVPRLEWRTDDDRGGSEPKFGMTPNQTWPFGRSESCTHRDRFWLRVVDKKNFLTNDQNSVNVTELIDALKRN